MILFALPITRHNISEFASKKLSEVIDSKVLVHDISYKPFDKAVLKGITFFDQKDKPFFTADYLNVKFSPFDLFRKKITIKSVELNNPQIDIYKETSSSQTNIQFLLDKLSNNSETEDGTAVNASLVLINNMLFKYNIRDIPYKHDGTLDMNHIEISNLCTNLKLETTNNDSVNLKIRNLSFHERNGIDVKKVLLNLCLGKDCGKITNLQINTPHSALSLNGPMQYTINRNGKESNLLNDINISGCKINSSVSLNELSYFIPDIRKISNDIIRFNSDIEKNKSDIRIHTKAFNNDSIGNVQLDADIRLRMPANKQDKFVAECDINNLELSSNRVKQFGKLLIANDDVLPILENAGDIKYNGTAVIRGNDIRVSGRAMTSAGELDEYIYLTGKSVKATLTTTGLDIGRLLADKSIFEKVSGTFIVDGTMSPLNIDVKSNVSDAKINGYSYHGINLTAKLDGNRIKVNGKLTDPNAHCDIQGLYNTATKSMSANLNVANMRPSKLNLNFGPKSAIYSGNIVADVKDLSSNMSGTVLVKNVVMQVDTNIQTFDSLKFVSTKQNHRNRAVIKSDMFDAQIDGNVELSDIPKLFAGIIERKIPEIKKVVKTAHRENAIAYFDVHTKEMSFIESVIGNKIHLNEPSYIGGRMSSTNSELSLVADIPSFIINGSAYKGATFFMKGVNDSLSILTQVTKSFNEDDVKFVLDATAQSGALLSQLEWKDIHNDGIQGYIKFLSESKMDAKGVPVTKIRFYPSTFLINDSLWEVSPSVFEFGNNTYSLKDFKIGRNNQFIQANGTSSPDIYNDNFDIVMNDMDLEYIFDLLNFHPVYFGGKASGEIEIQNPSTTLKADARLTVNDFTFNTGRMGTLHLLGGWDNDNKRVNIDAITRRGASDSTLIQGHVDIDADSIDLRFKSVNTTAAFLNQYLSGVFKDIQGNINGDLHLFGPLDAIQLEGDEEVTNVRLSPLVLNTDYVIVRDSVHFRPNRIIFDNVSLTDRDNHTALVNGAVTHRVLHDFGFDFNFSLNNFLAYDWSDKETDTFWGTIYSDGMCRLWGNPDVVHVDANLTPKKGTVFTYDSSNPESVEKKEYIHFTKPRIFASQEKQDIVHESRDKKDTSSDAYLNLNINTNPDATLVIITDNKTGDNMSLNGHGPLHATYYNKGRFDIYGTYTLDRGEYKITIQDIIHKRFKMQRGGTLRFNGEPFDGDLNMKGVYSVNSVSLSDLNLGNLSNSTAQVDCILNFIGKAGEPEVTFDLDFPNVNNEERQMVRNMIASQGDMNMQVMYLLGFGRFFTYDYATFNASGGQEQSTLAMTSLLANTLSGQLNNMLQNAFHVTNWSFGTNVATGRLGWQDVEVEGLLSGSLLNNRLIVNGNFGYRDQTTYSNNFVGDFNVRWLLNRSGTISLKGYSETNDRYFTKSSLTTNGAGILFQRDFNNLSEFFRSQAATKRIEQEKQEHQKTRKNKNKTE